MVAFLGFVAQHAATGKAPLEALGQHIANPWNANFATNGENFPPLFVQYGDSGMRMAARGLDKRQHFGNRVRACSQAAALCPSPPRPSPGNS